MILCGLGYARYSSYQLDGDAVAFMDIADAIRAHNFALVANGYWNPAYAAALALGDAISRPTRWTELQTFFWVNFWIFIGCIIACAYFTQGLVLLRNRYQAQSDAPVGLSPLTLHLASLVFLLCSFRRELNLGTVRSDALLLFFLLFAAAFLFRLQATRSFYYYPLLGAALGMAYLTKSFAFLPSICLLATLFLRALYRKEHDAERSRISLIIGALVALAVFSVLTMPYISAISKQRGRLTFGESARLSYAFFVDQTARWHEAHTGDLGHATAHFLHPEQLLLENPPVYSYASRPLGTYPLWFDPAYWTDTLQPHFWLHGHILRLERCTELLARFLIGHAEPFVLFAVLLIAGCCNPGRHHISWPLLSAAFWGLLMLAIYFPIDLQDRYLTGPFLLVVTSMMGMLQSRSAQISKTAFLLVMLLATLVITDSVAEIAQRRRLLNVTTHHGGAYSPEIYQAARGLNEIGVIPGSTVACFGSEACVVDHYWARLAGTQIRVEIEAPDDSDPGRLWPTKSSSIAAIVGVSRAQGVSAIVGKFAPSDHIPSGWQQLEYSDFYAYLVSPESHAGAKRSGDTRSGESLLAKAQQ